MSDKETNELLDEVRKLREVNEELIKSSSEKAQNIIVEQKKQWMSWGIKAYGIWTIILIIGSIIYLYSEGIELSKIFTRGNLLVVGAMMFCWVFSVVLRNRVFTFLMSIGVTSITIVVAMAMADLL